MVQVLSHSTHCIGHHIYVLGGILDCLVQSTNWLTMPVNYPNNETTIDITFCITLATFFNIKRQSYFWNILWLHIDICEKSPWKFVNLQEQKLFCNGKCLVGYLYLPEGSFQIIPINASSNIRIVATRICLNFFCAWCVFCGKTVNQQTKSPTRVMFLYLQYLE